MRYACKNASLNRPHEFHCCGVLALSAKLTQLADADEGADDDDQAGKDCSDRGDGFPAHAPSLGAVTRIPSHKGRGSASELQG